MASEFGEVVVLTVGPKPVHFGVWMAEVLSVHLTCFVFPFQQNVVGFINFL